MKSEHGIMGLRHVAQGGEGLTWHLMVHAGISAITQRSIIFAIENMDIGVG
jgi:uncharacterized RDD family membrane protein YckC